MKTCFTAMALGYLFLSSSILFSQSNALHESLHRASFSLAGEESTLPQFFIMQSRFITYEADGVRSNEDVVTLYLQTETKKEGNRILTTYKCKKFSFKFGKGQLLFVPSLANWSYKLSEDTSGIDEKGQVFGIPHSKFDNLMDNAGKPVPPDKSYMVYNTFIDFHSFCNVFAKKTLSGDRKSVV